MRQFLLICPVAMLVYGCTSFAPSSDSTGVYSSPAHAAMHAYDVVGLDAPSIEANVALANKKQDWQMVDLNGDGVDECIIAVVHFVDKDGKYYDLSTQGPCKHYLLQRQGEGWVVLSEFFADYYQYELGQGRTGGWRDLTTTTQSFSKQSVQRHYRWDGASYSEARDITTHFVSPAEAFVHEMDKVLPDQFDLQASVALLENRDVGLLIDINGDGVEECIVTAKHMVRKNGMLGSAITGAMGNYTHLILGRKGNGWTVLGNLEGGYYHHDLREQANDGWREISIAYLTGFDATHLIYRWDGSAYQRVK